MKIGGGTAGRHGAAAAGMVSLLAAGCASHSVPSSPAPPPPAVRPAVAVSAAPSAPPPVPPDAAELKQELAIVSSPQLSRERSFSEPGQVHDMGGAWVRFGPMRMGGIHPVLQKTGQSDVPFTAQLVVSHVQAYSDICPTKAQAAHAPLPYTESRTTIYLYDYQTTGTWTFQDQKDGPLIDLDMDKGRH